MRNPPAGFIVVAAVMDDGAKALKEFPWLVREWFQEMGSVEIWHLEYRLSFAFIGIMGKT